MNKNKKASAIIGENLKKIRKENKVKKREISELLGISVRYIGQIENGMKGIKASHIFKLSQFFSVPTDYFYLGVKVTPTRIKNYIDDFSQAELNFIMQMIEAMRLLRK